MSGRLAPATSRVPARRTRAGCWSRPPTSPSAALALRLPRPTQGQARRTGRALRHRPQAGCAELAPAQQGRGLPLRRAVPERQQDASAPALDPETAGREFERPSAQTTTAEYSKTRKRTTKRSSPAGPAQAVDFFIRTAMRAYRGIRSDVSSWRCHRACKRRWATWVGSAKEGLLT